MVVYTLTGAYFNFVAARVQAAAFLCLAFDSKDRFEKSVKESILQLLLAQDRKEKEEREKNKEVSY